MTTSTATYDLVFEDGRFVSSVATPGSTVPLASETRDGKHALSRFGAFLAPVAVAVALFPGATVMWRTYAEGRFSSSAIANVAWEIGDEFFEASAFASQEEIDELNRLYAMSPPAGFWIALPDA